MACSEFFEDASGEGTPKSSPRKSVDCSRQSSVANETEECIDPKQISVECEDGPDRLRIKMMHPTPIAELIGSAADLTASEAQAELADIGNQHSGSSLPQKKTRRKGSSKKRHKHG